MCAGLAFCLAGCQEKLETPVQETGFSLDKSVVDVPAEGGVMTVDWTVENPIEGMNVEIVPDYPEWINKFDTSVEGKISFNVEPYTEKEAREAMVKVNYGEDSSSFKVVQAGIEEGEEPDDDEIRLEIVEARPNTVIVSIETDGNLTYFINIEEKAVWDQYAGGTVPVECRRLGYQSGIMAAGRVRHHKVCDSLSHVYVCAGRSEGYGLPGEQY